MAVELATAYIALVPSLKGASQKISEQLSPAAASSGAEAGNHMGRSLVGMAAKWAAPLAAAVGFGAVLKTGFDEAKDAAAGTAQLAAGIASTGNAAHLSVDGLNNLASSIQGYSGQTDDSIVKSEQLLLTFTNIKNNGPDKIFDMATKASADMAAKFGGDASSQAVVLGKALNDPVKGITALTRVGVTFTQAQKDSIAAMMKTGDVAGAQKVILKELGTEFGGAAKAAGQSFPGQLQRVHRAFEDLSQGVVQGFLPVMGPALEGVITILQKVGPVAAAMAQHVADGAARIGKTFSGVFNGLKSLFMDGDITPLLLRSLGVEEDSPIIGGLMFLQTKFWAIFRGIHDFVTGFKIPSILGPENMGLNKFASAGAKVHGFLLDIKGGIGAMVAAFKAGGDDVTSSGFAGFLEGLGLKARKAFDAVKSALSGIDFGKIFGGLASTFGPLLPQIGQLATTLSPVHLIFEALAPVLPQIADALGQLASALGDALGSVLPVILPALTDLAKVLTGALGDAVTTVLPLIVSLIPVVADAFKQLAPVVAELIKQIGPLVKAILPPIVNLFKALAPVVADLFKQVLPVAVKIIKELVDAFVPLLKQVLPVAVKLIKELAPIVVEVFKVVVDVIKAALKIVQGIIEVVTGIISGDWGKVWQGICDIFSGIWDAIVAVVKGVFDILWSVISSGLNAVFGFIGSVLGNIGKFFTDVWNNIVKFLSGVWTSIVNGVVGAVTWYFTTIFNGFNAVANFIRSVFNGVANFLGGVWNNVVNGVSSMIGKVGGFFSGLWGTVTGALSGAGTWLYNAGRNIIDGLISGIGSMMGAIGNAILSLIPGPIVGVFKAALGIQSPSRVFRGFGKNIVEGLILGTGDKTDELGSTMRDLVTVPAVPSFGSPSASIAGRSSRNGGATFNTTINQVDDPIGTAHAVARRQFALSS